MLTPNSLSVYLKGEFLTLFKATMSKCRAQDEIPHISQSNLAGIHLADPSGSEPTGSDGKREAKPGGDWANLQANRFDFFLSSWRLPSGERGDFSRVSLPVAIRDAPQCSAELQPKPTGKDYFQTSAQIWNSGPFSKFEF